MQLSRRDFLKLSGAGTGGILLAGALGSESVLAAPPNPIRLHKRIGEKITTCAYCAGGCGALASIENGELTNVEGDPDHPINRGALCSKASSLYQIRNVGKKLNPRRLTKVLYRAPNDDKWQEKPWDWAIEEIAKRSKKTRDENWIEKDKDGNLVRRTEAIAIVGAVALDNEECYLINKAMRALGVVYMEHQARL